MANGSSDFRERLDIVLQEGLQASATGLLDKSLRTDARQTGIQPLVSTGTGRLQQALLLIPWYWLDP